MTELTEKQRIEALLRDGEHRAAIDACTAGISAAQEPSDYLRLRGRAWLASGDRRAARADFEAGLRTAPHDVRLLSNLGQLALGDGSLDEAERAFRTALTIEPANARALRGLAGSLSKSKRAADAIALLRPALERAPDDLETRLLLARLLLQEERPAEAVSLLARFAPAAAGGTLTNPRAAAELGAALHDAGEWASARAVLGAVIRAGDASRAVLLRFALSSLESYEIADALSTLDRAEALGFSGREFQLARAKAHFFAGEISEAIGHVDAVAQSEGASDIESQALFFRSHADMPSDELTAAHRRWGAKQPTDDAPSPRRAAREPLRVGYLSPDFREHVVMRFLEPVLDAHEHAGMQVVLLSTLRHADEVARQLASRFELHDLAGLDAPTAVATLRATDLDVIVDLAGHSSETSVALLAHRVAPLAASYLGYPSTTGLSTIDVRITDEQCDPLTAQPDFSERIAHLGRCAWAYVPKVALPDTTRSIGPPTFGCFNRACKWSPAQLELFARVLRRVPEASLLLKARGATDPHVRTRVLGALAEQGVGDRVTLVDWATSYEDALREYQLVDVTLDTHPYGGTTTTCDSLLMGVPVVSLSGSTPASRVGRSLLHAVGLEAFATTDADAYVEVAARAMSERNALASRREALRSRVLDGELGDARGLALSLRALFDRELAHVR